MTGISTLGICSVAVGAFALLGSPARAQVSHDSIGSPAQLSPDSISAERGAQVFKDKGCAACHNIAKAGEDPHRRPGGKQAGPDLAGVTDRRDREWLRRWLKDPDAMRASDPVAISMVAQAKYVKMPNMKLSDAQIEALINYLALKP